MSLHIFFKKVSSALRITPIIDGIEISETAVRYVRYEDGRVEKAQAPLMPGTMAGGRVNDYAQFVESLISLRREISGVSRRRAIHIAASISSSDVYAQVFSLPYMAGESLEKAIELNLKMVSPADVRDTYSGWQVIAEDQKSSRLDILSAFVNRTIADDAGRALAEAGFIVHFMEPRALSIARLIRELGVGFDPAASYVVITVDAIGMEFLVIKNAQLYFQYFNSWRDLQGDSKEISKEMFDAAVAQSLHRVVNFYNAHWTDRLAGIIVTPNGAQEETARVVDENFPIPILEFGLRLTEPLGAEWFAALGGSLRNAVSHREDRDISLLGITAQKEFRQHQIADAMGFWRMLIPGALIILLLCFFSADMFLKHAAEAARAQSLQGLSAEQIKEVNGLKAQVDDLNHSVALVGGVLKSSRPKIKIFEDVNAAIVQNNITLNQFSFQKDADTVLVVGAAGSENQILALKKTLEDNKKFSLVNLPFSNVKSNGQGSTFSMTFLVNSSSTN